nr:hypothetical protein [Anthocerotibacter panamensis]
MSSAPEYFWFDPFTLEFKGFRLQDGDAYGEIAPTEQERQRAELAEQRAETLAQRLRELGLEP